MAWVKSGKVCIDKRSFKQTRKTIVAGHETAYLIIHRTEILLSHAHLENTKKNEKTKQVPVVRHKGAPS